MTNRQRDRITAAFEQELARSPMPPALRAESVRAAVHQRRDLESQRQPWALALVAGLLAVAVVATLVFGARESIHKAGPAPGTSPPSATPTPSPSRISVSDSQFPATYSGPVLLFQIGGESQLRAISWDASTSGVLGGQPPAGAGMSAQSPDGSRYIAGGIVYDRQGRRLATLPCAGKDNSATFSADVQLLCKAEPKTRVTGSVMRLETDVPGQAPRIVASGFAIYGDNSTYPVLACDVATDRAIVAVLGQGVSAGRLWVFRLSTGAIIRTVDYGPEGAWVTATADGSIIAESVPTGNSHVSTTTIRRADNGVKLGTLSDFIAHGFSSNNSLLVGQTAQTTLAALVDWRSGKQLWSSAGLPGGYGGVRADPTGNRVAIGLGFVGGSDQADVYIVAPDGSAVLMPAHTWPVLQY